MGFFFTSTMLSNVNVFPFHCNQQSPPPFVARLEEGGSNLIFCTTIQDWKTLLVFVTVIVVTGVYKYLSHCATESNPVRLHRRLASGFMSFF